MIRPLQTAELTYKLTNQLPCPTPLSPLPPLRPWARCPSAPRATSRSSHAWATRCSSIRSKWVTVCRFKFKIKVGVSVPFSTRPALNVPQTGSTQISTCARAVSCRPQPTSSTRNPFTPLFSLLQPDGTHDPKSMHARSSDPPLWPPPALPPAGRHT